MADQRLRSVPLFAALPDEDLDRIDAATTLLRVAAGDRLFDEGDAATAAYVIVDIENLTILFGSCKCCLPHSI